jgi:protein-disulfide isomerase
MTKEIKILGGVAMLVIIAAGVGTYFYNRSAQDAKKPVTSTNSNTAVAGQLIRPDSPILGPADAKVTLVEFYDPECESCAAFGPIVKKILKENEGKIRLVARYMPLHPNSITAATFLEAAGEQGKYWQAQEILFLKQGEWGTKHGAPAPDPSAPSINQLFDKYAQELGLDLDKAAAAVKSRRFDAKIERDKKDGQSLGVRKTPTFFVNGRELVRFGEQDLRALIDEEMRK